MILIINNKKKEITISSKKRIREILESNKINPETVIPIKNNIVISLDDYAKDTDKITLFKVVSGG